MGILGILFTVTAGVSLGLYAVLDPSWSIPANTILLIILALIQRRTMKQAQETRKELKHHDSKVQTRMDETRDVAREGTEALAELADKGRKTAPDTEGGDQP